LGSESRFLDLNFVAAWRQRRYFIFAFGIRFSRPFYSHGRALDDYFAPATVAPVASVTVPFTLAVDLRIYSACEAAKHQNQCDKT